MFSRRDFSTAFFNSIPISGSLAGSMMSSQSSQQLVSLESNATNSLNTSKPSIEPTAASIKPTDDAANKDGSVFARCLIFCLCDFLQFLFFRMMNKSAGQAWKWTSQVQPVIYILVHCSKNPCLNFWVQLVIMKLSKTAVLGLHKWKYCVQDMELNGTN